MGRVSDYPESEVLFATCRWFYVTTNEMGQDVVDVGMDEIF